MAHGAVTVRRRRIALMVVIAVGLAGAVLVSRIIRPTPEVLSVATGEIHQTIVSSGQVMPPAEVRIDSLASGVIQELAVREGDEVSAGQLLVRLDDDELRAAVAQGKAAVGQARVGNAGLRDTTLPEATEARNRAIANVELARADYERSKKLFEAEALAKASLDQARVQLEIYESQQRAADLQVRAASSGGTSSQSAYAAIAVADAQLAAAEANLKRATIRAPLAGIVTQRMVELGESVRPGAALVVITATGRTRIVVEPDERNLALLKLGQKATISADAFPEASFEGSLSYIAPSVNAERGTIEVRLEVPAPPDYLRPNMAVSVELHIQSRSNAIAVPVTVVRELGSARPWVAVLVHGQRVVRRHVLVGLRGDSSVEVLSGLSPGDQVLLDPPSDARADPNEAPLVAPLGSSAEAN